MTPEAYRAFTERLLVTAAAAPDVLGLVALGSMSGEPPPADAFSDHDFFLVTRPGAQERWRTSTGWLPDAAGVVLSFRETAHGVKALWAGGHLAEYAVFDPEELSLARVNRYRVLLDRADVAARLERVRQATAAEAATRHPPDDAWLAGMLLCNLVVGAGRWARGERLSGHQLVRVHALGHLVALLRARLPAGAAAVLDDLDPFRRLERALPAAAATLDEALASPVPVAARAILELLARERPDLASPAALAAVARALLAAEAAAAG